MASVAKIDPPTLLWIGASYSGGDRSLSDEKVTALLTRLPAEEALVYDEGERLAVFSLVPEGRSAVAGTISALADTLDDEVQSCARNCRVLDGEAALGEFFAHAAGITAEGETLPRVAAALERGASLAETSAKMGPGIRQCLEAVRKATADLPAMAQAPERQSDIGAIAISEIGRLFGPLSRCRALLVGLGEQGETLIRVFRQHGLEGLTLCHKSPSRSQDAAHRLQCHFRPWDELDQALTQADIVVSDVGSGQWCLTKELCSQALRARKRRPIFLIDLGLPGDAEPAVADLSDLFLYTLDDLERLAGKEVTLPAQPQQARLRRLAELRRDTWQRWGRASLEGDESLESQLEAIRQGVHGELGPEGERATQLFRDRVLEALAERESKE